MCYKKNEFLSELLSEFLPVILCRRKPKLNTRRKTKKINNKKPRTKPKMKNKAIPGSAIVSLLLSLSAYVLGTVPTRDT